MAWIWVILCALGIYWYLNREPKKGQKQIPGPWGLPYLGNVLQLGKLMHIQFNKWTEKYGEIYQVKLGPERMIVMTNPKMIKEMFSNDATWTGRPHNEAFELYEGEGLGIVNAEGEMWEVHRRFLLRQLRDFGFGKSAMESMIFDELNEIIAKFKENVGKPVYDIKKILQVAVINALWTVATCTRFKHDDPKLKRLMDNSAQVVAEVFEKGAAWFLFMPWTRHVFPELSGYRRFRKVVDENCLWFEEAVNEHKKTFDENNLRDFIDVYLAEMKKTSDPDSPFYGVRAERQLTSILSDLFFAGNDTTSTTIAWGIFYMCKNPDIQRKFQKEVQSITNNSRPASVTDRPNMPYTLALIDEVLRVSSIVPTGVQHRALADKEFHGYYIPKDALITPNLYYMHHDKKIWGDPENFRPERFLSADGKKYVKNENLMAFQIGRRQCVGETMARDTVFLFMTNIFQRFDVIFDPDSPEPTYDVQPNFLLNPQPYSIVVTDRFAS